MALIEVSSDRTTSPSAEVKPQIAQQQTYPHTNPTPNPITISSNFKKRRREKDEEEEPPIESVNEIDSVTKEDWQCLGNELTASIQEDLSLKRVSPILVEKVTSDPVIESVTKEDWQYLAKALTASIQEDILFRLASPIVVEKVTSVPVVYEWLEKDDEELDLLLARRQYVMNQIFDN